MANGRDGRDGGPEPRDGIDSDRVAASSRRAAGRRNSQAPVVPPLQPRRTGAGGTGRGAISQARAYSPRGRTVRETGPAATPRDPVTQGRSSAELPADAARPILRLIAGGPDTSSTAQPAEVPRKAAPSRRSGTTAGTARGAGRDTAASGRGGSGRAASGRGGSGRDGSGRDGSGRSGSGRGNNLPPPVRGAGRPDAVPLPPVSPGGRIRSPRCRSCAAARYRRHGASRHPAGCAWVPR